MGTTTARERPEASGGEAIGLRLARQDQHALEDAYAAYAPSVLAYARRYVGRDEAEDVVQRTFLDACGSGPGDRLSALPRGAGGREPWPGPSPSGPRGTMPMRDHGAYAGASGYHPVRKVKVVLAGLGFAIRHDFSVAYKVVLSLVLVVVAAALRHWIDFVVVVLATGLVLTAELFNSAVEGVCDFMETGHDERIGAIKDVAAAAVGVSIVAWLVVIGYEGVQLIVAD